MKPKLLLFILASSFLTACQPKLEIGTEIPMVNLRELITDPSTLGKVI